MIKTKLFVYKQIVLERLESLAYTCFNSAHRYIEALCDLRVFEFFVPAGISVSRTSGSSLAKAVSYASDNSEKNMCSSGDSERIISWFIS